MTPRFTNSNSQQYSNVLFKRRYTAECMRINRLMIWLMVLQWCVAIAFAAFYSPYTWIGQNYAIHVHIWAAILLGGSISGFAILWTHLYPSATHTRHVMAISQMLWSALLIHLTGGRIETHFHVFASLAILSIYRDWTILITATVVVAVDHFIRGVFYPLSAFGIETESPYRWIEHAAWVIFEVAFLVPSSMRLRNEIRELCIQQTETEQAKQSIEVKVAERTRALLTSNEQLAQKTEEAEKLALVAQHTDNSVFITDANSRVEWVNEGFTRVTGYELDEVRGKQFWEFQHGPETNSNTLEKLKAAVVDRTGFDGELVNYRKNGESYWLSMEIRPIKDADGNVNRFVVIESDVSQRKAIEMSLASAEHRMRSLVNNVPGAFYRCSTDDDRTMQFISSAIEDISGYSPDDFLESGIINKAGLVHPDDLQMVNESISEAIAKQTEYEIEYRAISRDGDIKWVWERGQCLYDSDIPILDGTIFDVTQRKRSDEDLASKGKVIEDSMNEIFIFDADSLRFLYANRGGRSNLGYSLDELQKLTPLDIKPDFTFEEFLKLVHPLVSGEKEQIVFRTRHLRKDSSTYIAEVRLQTSTYQHFDVFLAMILDVTEQVDAETKNAQLQQELVNASRSAGMAEVVTGVLHNVGNILNSVNVSASQIRKQMDESAVHNLQRATQLISEHKSDFGEFVTHDSRGKMLPDYLLKITDVITKERDSVRDELDDLLSNVDHIKDIVSVQQSMAKSSGVSQRLDPQDVIQAVLTATKGSLIRHAIEVRPLPVDPQLGDFISDKHKILQILINLVSNAKESFADHLVNNPEISIEAVRVEDSIVFRVTDNGIGIPESQLSKIFQHGFTTKDTGHGFGLHSSANAATELGGSLIAMSEGVGHGACFELSLPLHQPNSQQGDSPSRSVTVTLPATSASC
ncbi:MAG: PAS domain S-box protein [Pirellulaceae bacterium]